MVMIAADVIPAVVFVIKLVELHWLCCSSTKTGLINQIWTYSVHTPEEEWNNDLTVAHKNLISMYFLNMWKYVFKI